MSDTGHRDLPELRDYDKDHCWQYEMRLQNLVEDLQVADMSYEQAQLLVVKDFAFAPLVTEQERRDATEFIKRHEWLGTTSLYTTHWFGAYYDGQLAGVLLFSMPNAFSKLLGDNTRELERLIGRGACISWSPKNLASSFIMWSIRWMAQNTQYRLFTAYSDPQAKELGTVYQACNFYYLGQKSGGMTRYINPYSGKLVSDRFFRSRSAYKKYAKELGIDWQPDWNRDSTILWENVPSNVERQLRQRSKEVQASADTVRVPAKHKYAMVLGANKTETRRLRLLFEDHNMTFAYPKERA